MTAARATVLRMTDSTTALVKLNGSGDEIKSNICSSEAAVSLCPRLLPFMDKFEYCKTESQRCNCTYPQSGLCDRLGDEMGLGDAFLKT